MDCNGESDRKDEPWQHDCEGNCISVHVYFALHSGAASLACTSAPIVRDAPHFTRGTLRFSADSPDLKTIITVLQKVYSNARTEYGKGSLR